MDWVGFDNNDVLSECVSRSLWCHLSPLETNRWCMHWLIAGRLSTAVVGWLHVSCQVKLITWPCRASIHHQFLRPFWTEQNRILGFGVSITMVFLTTLEWYGQRCERRSKVPCNITIRGIRLRVRNVSERIVKTCILVTTLTDKDHLARVAAAKIVSFSPQNHVASDGQISPAQSASQRLIRDTICVGESRMIIPRAQEFRRTALEITDFAPRFKHWRRFQLKIYWENEHEFPYKNHSRQHFGRRCRWNDVRYRPSQVIRRIRPLNGRTCGWDTVSKQCCVETPNYASRLKYCEFCCKARRVWRVVQSFSFILT